MPSFCHECGGELGENAKFCGSCGTPSKNKPDSTTQVKAEILLPEVIEPRTAQPTRRPVSYYEPTFVHSSHTQEFRDRTGFGDTFFQAFGSGVGGCVGQFVGCLAVGGIILFGLMFLGSLFSSGG